MLACLQEGVSDGWQAAITVNMLQAYFADEVRETLALYHDGTERLAPGGPEKQRGPLNPLRTCVLILCAVQNLLALLPLCDYHRLTWSLIR